MSAGVLAGLILALASTVALDAGFLLQQRGAARAPALDLRRPRRSGGALLHAPGWTLGFVIGLAGWALYLAALARAPLSLVQTVAAGGIGLLVIMSALLVRRSPTRRQTAGAALATAGLVALAVSAKDTTGAGHGASGLAFILLAIPVLAAVALGVARGSAASTGAAAGLLYGLGDVATKILLAALPVHPGALDVLTAPFLAVVLCCHGAAFLVLQRAFQRGGPISSVGPMTAATNLLPMAAGVLVLGDPLPAAPVLVVLRAVAFAATALGAVLLAESRTAADRPRERSRPATLATGTQGA
jgi:drug/metabolite transporter (DMT)-like permease